MKLVLYKSRLKSWNTYNSLSNENPAESQNLISIKKRGVIYLVVPEKVLSY